MNKKIDNVPDKLPVFLTAKDLQQLGFSRSMAYQLMNRADVPVLQIGERKFIQRDKFFAWVEENSGGNNK